MVVQTPVVNAAHWLAKKAEMSPSEVLELKSAYLEALGKVSAQRLEDADVRKFIKAKEILDRHHGVVS